jgi:hypothetical protein
MMTTTTCCVEGVRVWRGVRMVYEWVGGRGRRRIDQRGQGARGGGDVKTHSANTA